MWVNPPGGLLVETFEPDGIVHCTPPDASIRAGRTKMLDLYAFSRIAREAIASPRTVEFLSAVFEGQPKAFQGLTFWNGSQQAIHKDTAYVKIDSNPMHLVATWLALEDVQPGTGELEYYVGSHRAPDFLFGGSSKWMESHTSEHERFLQSLHDDATRLGHVKGSFLANKGDVLVWHADLAHGGSPVGQPSRTRKSLVTHYTPVSDDPSIADPATIGRPILAVAALSRSMRMWGLGCERLGAGSSMDRRSAPFVASKVGLGVAPAMNWQEKVALEIATFLYDVRRADGIYGIELALGNGAPRFMPITVESGALLGETGTFGTGWEPRVIYTGFAPVLLLEWRHQSGVRGFGTLMQRWCALVGPINSPRLWSVLSCGKRPARS